MIHQSLNATEILFLTLAYDWFLFGHDLPDRLTKGEDIFVFCFYALKYIQEEDFSVISHRYVLVYCRHRIFATSNIRTDPTQFPTDIEVSTVAAEVAALLSFLRTMNQIWKICNSI